MLCRSLYVQPLPLCLLSKPHQRSAAEQSCEKDGCAGQRPSSRNVLISDCVFHANYRQVRHKPPPRAWELLTHQTALTWPAPRLQGISVVAAENVMVRNTTLSGTGVPWGTPPMSGTTIHV